jgi:hypothetical protein
VFALRFDDHIEFSFAHCLIYISIEIKISSVEISGPHHELGVLLVIPHF